MIVSPFVLDRNVPYWDLREEVRLGRTEMSRKELGRVEVLARVKSRDLRVVDAAVLLRLSYRRAPQGLLRARPTTKTRTKTRTKTKTKRGHF